MASIPPPSASTTAAAPHKPARILACVLCQHRKIKCDRTFPCANCTKANYQCVPSKPAPPRKRRRPNEELQERLARCEKLLKEYATAAAVDHPSSGSLEPQDTPSSTTTTDSPKPLHTKGKIIYGEDGSIRFVDNMILGSVYDQLQELRQVLDDDVDIGEDESNGISADTSSTAYEEDEHLDLVLPGSPLQNAEELRPAAVHVFPLWQLYLERCNPLSKIIHVPTVQPFAVEATCGAPHFRRSVEALLFSIYTLAVVAMTPEECEALLGYSSEVAFRRFSTGTRIALQRASFLKAPDTETLQAFCIYLQSLYGRYDRSGTWILNGLAVRMAQKMGLHRDGEALGLPPFETEMRRRLWWHIICVDSRYATLCGLSNSNLPQNADTQLPKNVNDADLFPGLADPVQDRDGPTEMILVLMLNQAAQFILDTVGMDITSLLTDQDLVGSTQSAAQAGQLEDYRRRLKVLGISMNEMVEKYCDPAAGPAHELARLLTSDILHKFESFTRPVSEQEHYDEVKTPQDAAWCIAIQSMYDAVEHARNPAHAPFLWFARQHFHLETWHFIVGQLCMRDTGRLVEKAWDTVEKAYDLLPELHEVSSRASAQVGRLLLRAWKKREHILTERHGSPPVTPLYICKVQIALPSDESRSKTAKARMPIQMGAPAGTLVHEPGSLLGFSDPHPIIPNTGQNMETYAAEDPLEWNIWNQMPLDPSQVGYTQNSMYPPAEW